MSTQAPSSGPIPSGGGVALPPTPQRLQQAFEAGIWYHLSLWSALHIACQNNWGGPNSSDKRDWFAGAVSDLFTETQTKDGRSVDHEYLVAFLLQIMQDEFDTTVEDDSEEKVAEGILGLRKRLFEDQDMSAIRELEQRWRNRGQMKVNIQVVDNGDDEVDDEEWEGFDEDGDVDMADDNDAPALVPAPVKQEKQAPEVDEEGFTKVVSKKGKR